MCIGEATYFLRRPLFIRNLLLVYHYIILYVGVAIYADNENGKLTTCFAYKVYPCALCIHSFDHITQQQTPNKRTDNILVEQRPIYAIIIEIYHYFIVQGDASAAVCKMRLFFSKICTMNSLVGERVCGSMSIFVFDGCERLGEKLKRYIIYYIPIVHISIFSSNIIMKSSPVLTIQWPR